MFGFLQSSPEKKLQKQYEKLLQQAMQLQRNGDIKSYSMTIAEAEKVLANVDKLKKS